MEEPSQNRNRFNFRQTLDHERQSEPNCELFTLAVLKNFPEDSDSSYKTITIFFKVSILAPRNI